MMVKTSTWFKTFQELKTKGVDPLTAEEKALRHLPIEQVTTIDILFQPRQLEGSEGEDSEASRSGRHLGVLQRSIQNQGRLSPITVVKIQGAWVCCDGYHRLIAYRMEKKRRATMGRDATQRRRGKELTHIPVTIFTGSFEEAYQLSVKENSQDKLNMSEPEKLEACWRRVLLGIDDQTIQTGTTMSLRTIRRMKKLFKDAVRHSSQVDFTSWPYAKVVEFSRHWDDAIDRDDHWMEKKAQEWSRHLARHFNGLPTQHPTIFARALVLYNPETARDVADQIAFLQARPEE